MEDEALVRELIEEVLRGQGYAVQTAFDGQDGLRLSAEAPGHFDLILTDVVMPRLNGPEFVELARADQPDAKFMFMSGYACSVPIDDRAVSRQHAELSWRNGLPQLQDTSRHGTLVDGRPIDLRVLENGDLVRMGGFQFTFCDRLESKSAPKEMVTCAEECAVLQGRIAPGSLCEVVQSLALGHKSGRLHVSSEVGEKSWLVLRDGMPIAARHGSEAQGLEAALSVLSTSTGRFVFFEGGESEPLEFRTSLMSLLLEASRRQDECPVAEARSAG